MASRISPASRILQTACAALLLASLAGPVLAAPAKEQSALANASTGFDKALLDQTLQRAASFPQLNAIIVARDGKPVAERVFHGPPLDRPVNVKSVSKTVIAALVGVAIDKGVLTGTDQTIGPLLSKSIPPDADPRVRDITIGNLLSMRAGLERTSGPNYGRWISSPNWVRYVLSRPFVDEPGGGMLYSTGNSHLLSAILTKTTGRTTLDLARDWLGKPLGITIPAWTRDPQGIYFGGNQMALSPRAMLRLGELYRQGGELDGKRVFPESWVEASWKPEARSVHSGDYYGYGWFSREMAGHTVHYAWGFGGQMIYVVPDLALTVVMTSDPTAPSGRNGYVEDLHALMADGIIPAASATRNEAQSRPGSPGG